MEKMPTIYTEVKKRNHGALGIIWPYLYNRVYMNFIKSMYVYIIFSALEIFLGGW